MSKITVELIDNMGSDLTVVNAARVSFGNRSKSLEKRDHNLIRYLANHKHTSPFGHCFATFHVKAPIFVARQLVKHKFLRWNEISRRYVDNEPEFYLPEVWRGRSVDKKQGSAGVISEISFVEDELVAVGDKDKEEMMTDPNDDHLIWQLKEYSDTTCSPQELVDYFSTTVAFREYKRLIDNGIAPEQARMILPQNTMTEWWWSGSLDAFADMCILRCKSDTQYETRMVANQIDKLMEEKYPTSWKALCDAE